jgi:hypothetical protein
MTLRMAFVAGFLTCVLVTWLLGKRREAQTYKVYDQPEVDMLQDEIRNRKLGIRS